MTFPDDYPPDMTESFPRQRDGLDDTSIQFLLGARSRARSAEFSEVAGVLTELRALVEVPAPTPSPELAALLQVGLAPAVRREAEPTPRTRRAPRQFRRVLVVAGLSSLVSFPLMGVAAAQDRLPDTAQHVVATVIRAATPFTVADPQVDSTRPDSGTQSPKKKKSSRSGGASPATVPRPEVRDSKPSDREPVNERESTQKEVKEKGPQGGPVAEGSTPGSPNGNGAATDGPTVTPTPSPSTGGTGSTPTGEPTTGALAPPPDETETLSGGGTLTAADPAPAGSPSPTTKTKASETPAPSDSPSQQTSDGSEPTSEPSTSLP